jgi:16S rRNA (guanine966-N2)-methyltransferase
VRVIAGQQRGRRLRVPRGLQVRPALARVKTSLFDILTSRGLVEGARILDLFAGSGSLGIEALSRGAASAVFVEQDRGVAHVLQSNVTASGFEDRSMVEVQPCLSAIPRLARRGDVFDGVFVDPPYGTTWVERTLRELASGTAVRPGAWVVVHHRRGEDPAHVPFALRPAVQRRIGDAVVVVYRHEPEQIETEPWTE